MAGPAAPVRSLASVGAGLRGAWADGYGVADFRKDLLAGLTIGVVAIPLAMALAVATGVPPQYGLYSAIVAGIVIALFGGSRFNVSGPTAAFVVILLPIVQQHGIGGLLVATFMAGAILVAMGMARMGGLLQFVPYPVVLGFTAGIGVVIATLQLADFLGLATTAGGEHYTDRVIAIVRAMPGIDLAEFGIGLLTLATILLWPRLRTPVPAPLAALVVASAVAWAANSWVDAVIIDTIASRFSWEVGGLTGHGIPPVGPAFALPWRLPGADGVPLQLSFDLFQGLLGPAIAIAILAAIESLLCGVIADGLTRTRHDPNAELIGQGLGNMVAPFFGGITATAAIARTATNIRSGARSPVAALFIHRMSLLTHARRLEGATQPAGAEFPAGVVVYDVNGLLFFAAAEKAVASVRIVDSGVRVVVLDMRDVPSMDHTAVVAMQGLVDEMHRQGIALVFAGLAPRMVLKLLRAGVRRVRGRLAFCASIEQAARVAAAWIHAG